MEELDLGGLLKKVNGRSVKVLDDEGALVTRGIINCPETNSGAKVKVGDIEIPLNEVTYVDPGCEGASPILYVIPKYELVIGSKAKW